MSCSRCGSVDGAPCRHELAGLREFAGKFVAADYVPSLLALDQRRSPSRAWWDEQHYPQLARRTQIPQALLTEDLGGPIGARSVVDRDGRTILTARLERLP